MLLNIIIGSIMVLITTAIHGFAMLLTIQFGRKNHSENYSNRKKMYMVSAVVLILFLTAVVEILVWALTYLTMGAFSHFETSLYFSAVTYTTLGYGDIVLDGSRRILSAFQAANGIIMFSWSGGIVVAVVQYLYARNNSTAE